MTVQQKEVHRGKELSLGHTANKRRSWESNPVCLTPKFMFYPLPHTIKQPKESLLQSTLVTPIPFSVRSKQTKNSETPCHTPVPSYRMEHSPGSKGPSYSKKVRQTTTLHTLKGQKYQIKGKKR